MLHKERQKTTRMHVRRFMTISVNKFSRPGEESSDMEAAAQSQIATDQHDRPDRSVVLKCAHVR